MSSYIQPYFKTFKAGGAIEQFRFVKFGSADNAVVKAGAAEKAIGVHMNTNNEDAVVNQDVEVAIKDGALVKLAGTVARGDSVMSDADGLGVVGTATNWCAGIAQESGVAGDVISIKLDGHYLPA